MTLHDITLHYMEERSKATTTVRGAKTGTHRWVPAQANHLRYTKSCREGASWCGRRLLARVVQNIHQKQNGFQVASVEKKMLQQQSGQST